MNRTLFLTGGTRGIGEAILRLFSEKEYSVAFTYNEREDRARELMGEYPGVLGRKLPLGNSESGEELENFIKEAMIYFGIQAFDAAVINAGESMTGMLTDSDEKNIDRNLNVNLKGAILSAKAVMPGMIKAGEGSIILISSIWGERAASCETVYSAGKAGIIGFGRSLAAELGPSGVRVNIIAPGVIDTDMNKGFSREELNDLKERTPLGRLGEPEDIARAALFLSGEEASFITGQVLTVDGGFSI